MPRDYNLTSKQAFWLAVVLLFFGAALAWLMVLDLISTTFLIAFISFATSTSGLILGIIALAIRGMEHSEAKKDRAEPNMFDFDKK